MKTFNIIEEKENPLFNRKELKISIKQEIHPKREEIMDLISNKFSVPKENIKIKKIHGKFGSKDFIIELNIYSNQEEKDSIELKKKKDKKTEAKPVSDGKEKEEKQELAQPDKEPTESKPEEKEE